MKVLLTGASGFLGRYVLHCLRSRSIETVVLGRRRALGSDLGDFIEADLLTVADFPALVRPLGATHLLHLAWYAEHGKYWTSPLNLRWVDASTRLIEAFCEGGGKHVVAAGTCAEYDWFHGYCREDITPLDPATLYGTAKDATRRLAVAVCAQQQIPCAWGRVFLPFGAGEDKRRLVPSLMEVFQGRRSPFAVNALSYRDFLHASDVATAFIALLDNGESRAYNISSGQPVRISELVQKVAQMFDADPQIVLSLTDERPSESSLVAGENLRLKALGWQPATSLEEGLERTAQESLNS